MKTKQAINQPLVSVIITTYKRADFLHRAIRSVLKQSYENIEIIVVDDNNPDTIYRNETEYLMQSYINNPKVYYVKHKSNLNGASARNTGINNARGKYVTYLDDDDLYFKEKVENQVRYLETNPDFDACYCGWVKNDKFEYPNSEGNLMYELLSGDILIRTNVIMMKRAIAEEIGGWDTRYKRNQEVGYLSKYFAKGYLMGSVPEVLVYFDDSSRINESNPEDYEQDFSFMLQDQTDNIKNSKILTKEQANKIYVKRYRSVLLRYLKNNRIKDGLRVYFNGTQKYPIEMNIDMIQYSFNKIFS